MQIGKSSLGNKHGTTANGTLRTPSDWVMTLKKLSGLKFSALPRECSRYVQCTPQTLTSLESLEPGAPLGHFTPSRVEFVRCPQNCRTCDCLSTDIHSHPAVCCYIATPKSRSRDATHFMCPWNNFLWRPMLRGPGGLCSWLRPCDFLQCRGQLALKTFCVFSARDEVEFVAQSPHSHHGRQRHRKHTLH